MNEFSRDIKAGIDAKIPLNYFIDDDPKAGVDVKWRGHGICYFQTGLTTASTK